MLLTMANILAMFDIALPYGSSPPEVEFTTGITRFALIFFVLLPFDALFSHIKPFELDITVRR